MALENPRNGKSGGSCQVLKVDLDQLYALGGISECEGLTTTEWGEQLNLGVLATRKVIKAAVQAGVLIRGDRWVKADWDGKARKYSVYFLAKKGT
jgi:hypothetical protein